MAKKDKLKGMFEPAIGDKRIKVKQEDKVNPIGVALEKAEIDRLDQIAKELDQSRHALLKYAVRDFIRRYDRGEKPTTRKETKVILDAG